MMILKKDNNFELRILINKLSNNHLQILKNSHKGLESFSRKLFQYLSNIENGKN